MSAPGKPPRDSAAASSDHRTMVSPALGLSPTLYEARCLTCGWESDLLTSDRESAEEEAARHAAEASHGGAGRG